jgi:hypothetical protein
MDGIAYRQFARVPARLLHAGEYVRLQRAGLDESHVNAERPNLVPERFGVAGEGTLETA